MLKILVINDDLPYVRTQTSVIFKNIIPILSQRLKIKIYWFVSNDAVDRSKATDSHYEFLFKSDFKNAREVVEKIKPSLIWVLPGNNLFDYSFLLTARELKIPTFGWGGGIPAFARVSKKRNVLREWRRQFFEISENKKDGGKNLRGIDYLKKYLFLIKSLRAIGKNYIEIVSELITMIKLNSGIIFSTMNEANVKFNCDLMFVGNNRDVDYLAMTGLSKKNMVVTGDPIWDEAFEKRGNDNLRSDKEFDILFLTVNLTGGQGESDWTIHKRDKMIKELISQYEKLKNEISLKIKIHPTSERYIEYKQILDNYKTDAQLFQHEDLIQLIMKSNVILTTSASSAGTLALIMKKPVIIWNYFHVHKDSFLDHGVALECKNASELKNCLDKVESFANENQFKIDGFINDFFGTGNASENMVQVIEKFMTENST